MSGFSIVDFRLRDGPGGTLLRPRFSAGLTIYRVRIAIPAEGQRPDQASEETGCRRRKICGEGSLKQAINAHSLKGKVKVAIRCCRKADPA